MERIENLYRLVSTAPWHTENEGTVKLVESPLPWQLLGLQQTATGYGRKLTTIYKAEFKGKFYRVYCTCFSNAGSCWFMCKGTQYFVG